MEKHKSLNAGNDLPVAQVQTEGQANANIRSQDLSQRNQDNTQRGGFFPEG